MQDASLGSTWQAFSPEKQERPNTSLLRKVRMRWTVISGPWVDEAVRTRRGAFRRREAKPTVPVLRSKPLRRVDSRRYSPDPDRDPRYTVVCGPCVVAA